MTKQSHTSEPWEIIHPAPNKGYVQIHGAIDCNEDGHGRSTHICDIIDNEEEEENARLIAAAPVFLKALKEIAKSDQVSFQHALDYQRIARSAIAQAGVL